MFERRLEVVEFIASLRGPDSGCSRNDLKSTGSDDGLFYYFATN